MTPSPILIPRQKPQRSLTVGKTMRTPNTDFLCSCFSFAHCLFQVATEMPRLRRRCVDSLLLLGALKGFRIPPSVQLRIVLATINLGYAGSHFLATLWNFHRYVSAIRLSFFTCLFRSTSWQLHKGQTAETSQTAAFRRKQDSVVRHSRSGNRCRC